MSQDRARRLGVAYLDTGAMYRAVTWSALQAGIELSDADAVAAHAEEFDLAMGIDPASCRAVPNNLTPLVQICRWR